MWRGRRHPRPHEHLWMIVGVENHPAQVFALSRPLPVSVIKRMCFCQTPDAVVVEGTWTETEAMTLASPEWRETVMSDPQAMDAIAEGESDRM